MGAPLQLPAGQRLDRRGAGQGPHLQDELDLRDGARSRATGRTDRCWRSCGCPAELRAKANPKSSTGRIDVFTRVITDATTASTRSRPATAGPVSGGRAALVRGACRGAAQPQPAAAVVGDARVSDDELRAIHADARSCTRPRAGAGRGARGRRRPVPRARPERAARARRRATARSATAAARHDEVRHYDWRDYWEPV